ARPERDVLVLVGDGGYLMMNSEIATSVMLGRKLTIVVLDNRGYGCIDRLQRACGGEPFNNLFDDIENRAGDVAIDFASHARSVGATADKVDGIGSLERALERAKSAKKTHVIVIDTDPRLSTADGGAWWDVAIPEVSERELVRKAREAYVAA